MLGLSDIKTYQLWTKEFNPTSTYEGNWQKGSEIFFIGTDQNGKRGGMDFKKEKTSQTDKYQFNILDF